jgi:hypothetical protein
MAKHIILESYTFVPGTRTVTINNKYVRREQLLLITNVTTNTIIYNFSDASLTASSYVLSSSLGVETTTIVLTKDTTSMSSTDKLAILVEEVYQETVPAEAFMDPVGKSRVSTPQALIDTDFEYGVQSTKWETLALTNNRPSAFYDPTQGITNISNTLIIGGASGTYQITAIAGNGTRTVTVSINNTTNITTSTPVYIQDTVDSNANGWYLPASISANVNFTYIARGNVTNGSVFDTTKTIVFVGAFYTQAAIPVSASAGAAFSTGSTAVTCTTTYNHGLTVGQAIYVVGTTAATSNPPNGAWYVRQTPTSNTFVFDVTVAPVGAITATAGASATLYPRTWGSSVHRAFDGGVTFTAGYPYHGNQLIRQTRRYFRYQSGKGIMFSTGSNFCSPLQVDSITSSGTTCTVTTKFPHNLGVGAAIRVAGADQSAYNGTGTAGGSTFVVASIPTDTTFTYVAASAPSVSPATSSTGYTVQPYQWYGASIRVGMFDSQNGFYFEYDGTTLYAVERNSTTQLVGYISALTNGQQSCTGVGTRWSQTLIPGSFIVIRGMTYTVVSIESDTSMTIYPDYRGTTIASPSQVVVSLIQDIRYPQSSWNIDKMDGTGVSGNTIDITKMQMWYIDYSWYGAGAIRFGFKNARGEVNYVHRVAHGNARTEAYMRSGNLPARYEVNTFYPKTILGATLASGDSAMNVVSTTGFPSSGTLIVSASGNTGAAIEYVNYTGKTSNTFTGLTRAVGYTGSSGTSLSGPGGLTLGGGGIATTFTYSATAPVSVAFWGPQAANTISHWGSSVIMDGRYDDDKSLVFVAGMSTSQTITSGSTVPLISLRIAPSVDSGITGLLGQREIINKMQLILRQMDVFTTSPGYVGSVGAQTSLLVSLRLNGQVSSGTFAAAGGSSLAQVAFHSGATITGGETIFGFFTATPGVTSQDLLAVRELGNSILGGGNTLTVPSTLANKYPDGPDLLTVVVQNVGSAGAGSIGVNARISWTEAQA